MGSLDGKVAVVTGAAHGLGRLHALGLAAEGAAVVVNDLGVAADGSGRDDSAAQAVVDEIKSAGGEAVAHSGDVADFADAEGMIRTAIESYGDLDILINNAGFTRDGEDVISASAGRLSQLEKQADRQEIDIRQALLAIEGDYAPLDVMFIYRVIDWIGTLADRADRVGTRLQILVTH